MGVKVSGTTRILDRLRSLSKSTNPNSPAVRAALTRAALLIVNQAKINIRRQGLIDEGNLVNSIKFEFTRPEAQRFGVNVGSFGVPYAAVWEGILGTRIKIKSHTRVITQAFGRNLGRAIPVTVDSHIRNIRPRPYLGPAFQLHRDKVRELVSEALRNDN